MSIDIDGVISGFDQPGQVRRNLTNGGNLIELLKSHIDYDHARSWTVSDLLTGKEFKLSPGELGCEVFNGMEALAWVVMRSQKQ